MDQVRDLVAAGGVSVVLAQDRDRFSREPAYTYLLRREFQERRCELKALNDRRDGSPEGELTDGILDQLAKYERAKISERSRRGRLRKAREGKLLRNGLHGERQLSLYAMEVAHKAVVDPKPAAVTEGVAVGLLDGGAGGGSDVGEEQRR
jgi:site-specific DNA recombinase